jgi:hypothetical protein
MNCVGFVYIWFDTVKNMYYIGSHNGPENDGYVCTSKPMLKEYVVRPHTFKRKVLERNITYDKKHTLTLEQKWLDMIGSEELFYGKKRKYYNIKAFAAGGDNFTCLPEQIKNKIKKKRYGIRHSNAIKEAIRRRTPLRKKLHQERRKISLQKIFQNPLYTNYQDKLFEFYVNGVCQGVFKNKTQLRKKFFLEGGCIYKMFLHGTFTFKENRINRKNPFKAGDKLSFSYI